MGPGNKSEEEADALINSSDETVEDLARGTETSDAEEADSNGDTEEVAEEEAEEADAEESETEEAEEDADER